MALSPEVLTILVVLALGLAGLAAFIAVRSTPRGGRRIAGDQEAVAMLTHHDEAIDKLRGTIRSLAEEQRRQAEAMLGSVQRVGLVRYDAFGDMGGQLSFSTAFLDGNGDGVVITSINGRQETRCYAKPVEGWASRHNLSTEEEQAIRQALASSQVPAPKLGPAQGRQRLVRRGA